jgi:rRNA-processing protein FCF1
MKRGAGGRRRPGRLLVDTNLLLLYIVGSLNPEKIGRHKRTDKFTIEDYKLFLELVQRLGSQKIVVTPNILTEVSNLLGQTDEQTRKSLMILLSSIVPVFEELTVSSADAVRIPEFTRLGLTDSTILYLSEEGMVFLTDDLHLYLALQRRGVEVINFNHVREASWREE